MNRIRFIDRKEEVRYLKEAAELSQSKLFTVSITGLRRVGKTRLILELLSKKLHKNKIAKF